MHRLVFALLLTHALVAFASVASVDDTTEVTADGKDEYYGANATRQELFDRFGKRLFAMTCDDQEELYTNYTGCIWPQSDPIEFIRQVVRSGVAVGCKMPPRSLMQSGLEFLESDTAGVIKDHPLYGKLPDMPCGLCSRRIRCCTRARSFFTQGLNSTSCDIDTTPCDITPITDDEMAKLKELHPEIPDGIDRCDYYTLINASLDKLHESDLFLFARRAVCQLFGTTRPNMKCISVDNTCKCCCTGSHYDLVKDTCVADEEIVTDDMCIEMME